MRAFTWMLLGCSVSNAAPPAPSQAPPGFWDHWGDGRAEVAAYTLTIPRYGQARDGEVVLVTVTEDFDPAQSVKSERRRSTSVPVLKLNEVRDFQTGVYDYNGLTSVFVPLTGRVPLGQPLKVSFSLQEWCGHAYEQLVRGDDGYARTLHSYFDGEANQQARLDTPAGGVVEDAMPLLARGLAGALVAPGASREVPWLRSRLRDRMDHRTASWTTATLGLTADASRVTVPAGSFEVRTLSAEVADGRELTWQVEVAAPHRLIRWSHSDGEVGELTGVSREPYWNQHGNGQESKRAELGLPAPSWP
jgi:hypothetical protein